MERTFKIIVFLLLVASFSVSAVSGGMVPSVYIFGDSIFDAGNNHYNIFCSAQADFPPYGSSYFHHATGRFTNGRTVADFLSQFLDLPLQKPFHQAEIEIINGTQKTYPSNGLNFASAGSGVLAATNQDMNVTALQAQLQQFKSLVLQSHIDKKLLKDSFFFLESGSNDIFNYFYPFNTPNLTQDAYIQSMVTEVTNFVHQIYMLGARKIALFSVGPVGCVPARAALPDAPIDKCYGKMNKMVKNFNMGLENFVKDIPTKYPGSVAVYGVVYKMVQLFRANPSLYGFANATSACCGSGTLGGLVQCGKEGYTKCSNPDSYVFWDYFHPSERTYKLISKALWSGGLVQIRPMNLKKLQMSLFLKFFFSTTVYFHLLGHGKKCYISLYEK